MGEKVFKPYIDVNLKFRAVHLKFGSTVTVRNFAGDFLSERVVSYGSTSIILLISK